MTETKTKRRSKDQQIADLQARQALDVQRALARAGVDELKTQLHKRDYKAARSTVVSIGAALGKLLEAEQPTEIAAPAETASETDGGDRAAN